MESMQSNSGTRSRGTSFADDMPHYAMAAGHRPRSRSNSFAETVPAPPPSTYDWTVTAVPRTNPTMRIFCIPHAGQLGSNPYRSWADVLPDHIEQVTLIPGGRARVDAVLDGSIDDPDAATLNNPTAIIEGICQVLATSTNLPFAVFGHSAGAALALHAVATMQRRQAVLPMHLFVSGCSAPQDFEPMPAGWHEADTLMGLVKEWAGGEELAWAKDADARDVYLGRLRADLHLLESSCRLMQAVSASANNSSSLRQLLHCDITVLGGVDDATVPLAALQQWQTGVVDTAFKVSIVQLAGGHFYLEDGGDDDDDSDSQGAGAKRLLATVQAVLHTALVTAQAKAETQVRAWNDETMVYPDTKRIHDTFIEQAARTPDAIAICDPMSSGQKVWTYKQVAEETDLLASYLVAHGCGPGKVVGLMMNRSAAYVLGYIAAHKAGGAYMPIELAYPHELIQRVLDETQAVAVLTQKPHDARLPPAQRHLVVDANGRWKAILAAANEGRGYPRYDDPTVYAGRVDATPDDLAYVVMSSGTTGVPKGIMCPHRGAVHSYHWRHEHYPLQPDDRAGCAVFFVWEVFRPLMRGLPTYIIPDNVIYDADALSLYVQEHRITRILFTPSLLQLILDSLDANTLVERMGDCLRIVWLCGEVVTLELQQRFKSLFPGCELLNLYSISECHDVSVAVLEGESVSQSMQIRQYASCGKVMENVKCYVLDPNTMHNQPIGTPGEVYVGGPCLAIGYLNMPEKTAERFVDNPFVALDGPGCSRLYRTGDRGRFLPDGTLELCGRCDSMVKIRGYSVVLGAVEAALAEHPLVSTAVVVAEGDEGTDKRLVAYIVPAEWERVPSAHTLRKHLKELVPFYAVPPVMLLLNALPVAAIGKLEKKKLRESARRLPAKTGNVSPVADDDLLDTDIGAGAGVEEVEADEVEPPTGEVEEKLADIWKGLLKIDTVARRDSFFEVGGHSLLAVRLVAKLRDNFFAAPAEDGGVLQNVAPITLSEVLKHPTLSAMAGAIAGRFDSPATSPVNAGAGRKVSTALGGGSAAQTTAIDWKREAVLDDMIYPAATRKAGYSRLRPFSTSTHLPPRRVLLTGATGFLGAFLLSELLKSPETTVFCLVRAANHDLALERIESNLKLYGLSSPDGHVQAALDHQRVVPIAGDLSKPLLGLDAVLHKELATVIDSIVHCASVVNLMLPYQDLKAANCLGTQEVLRLAVTNGTFETRVKPVFYISTNGVFPYGTGETFTETDVLPGVDHLSDGYGQSKYVAEQLVLEARHRGLPVCILRPGNMAGCSTSGAWNPNDFVRTLLVGCRRLGGDAGGVVPSGGDIGDWSIDLTPVDWAARAIVHCVMHPATALGRVYHVQSPHTHVRATEVFAWLKELGSQPVPVAQFQHMLEAAATAEADSAVEDKVSPSSVTDAVAVADRNILQRLFAAYDNFHYYFFKPPVLKSDQFLHALGPDFDPCPIFDAALLKKYLGVASPSGPQ